MKRWLRFLGIILAVSSPISVWAEEVTTFSPRQSLRAGVYNFSYPGTMLFHNAFFGAFTTRFLLLKAALHSEEVAKYLTLNEQQRLLITSLRPVEVDPKDLENRFDPNDQPDEQIVDAKYFDCLQAEQLLRLDLLAFRYDGYIALTRKSFADQLNLTEASRTKIAHVAARMRKFIILPNFRANFAGTPLKDSNFRQSVFVGAACTQLNLEIIELLTDQECEKLQKLCQTQFDEIAFYATDKMAVMPDGIHTLRKYDEP